MATKKKSRKQKQPDDFKSVAKRLGCDENKAAFEKKLGKIARSQKSASAKGRRT